MTHREATAALFVIGLAIVSALIGWALAGVLGLILGLALGLLAADRITRLLERDNAWSIVTRRR